MGGIPYKPGNFCDLLRAPKILKIQIAKISQNTEAHITTIQPIDNPVFNTILNLVTVKLM